MGIIGSFLYLIRKGLYYKVSLKELADRQRKSSHEAVTLIVDGSSLHLKFLNEENRYGWQWDSVISKLKTFVGNLRELGIEPIFYFKGGMETFDESKQKQWFEKDNEIIRKIFESLKRDEECDLRYIPHTSEYFRYILKFECGCEVFNTIKNHYSKLADIARNEEKCLGILAVNADYLIFDTKPLLSFEKLDFSSMTTYLFLRSDLVRATRLNDSQLKLLSCLAGNDVIHYKSLQHFHECIGYKKNGNFLIEKIRDFIKQKNWNGESEELSEIAEIVDVSEKLLSRGISSYGKPSEFDVFDVENIQLARNLDTVKEKYIGNDVPAHIYNLLRYRIYTERASLEDVTVDSLPSPAVVYREMRQKMYRILFKGEEVIVDEWCSYREANFDQPDRISTHEKEFEGSIPSLDSLLSENNDYDRIRWPLFSYCVGMDIPIDKMKELNGPILSLCCILRYLLMHGVELQQWEVEAFICQALHPHFKNSLYLNELKMVYSPRILQLCDLLEKGLLNLMHVVTACGFPFPLEDVMPWKAFNRKLFIHSYNQLAKGTKLDEVLHIDKNAQRSAKELCSMVAFRISSF